MLEMRRQLAVSGALHQISWPCKIHPTAPGNACQQAGVAFHGVASGVSSLVNHAHSGAKKLHSLAHHCAEQPSDVVAGRAQHCVQRITGLFHQLASVHAVVVLKMLQESNADQGIFGGGTSQGQLLQAVLREGIALEVRRETDVLGTCRHGFAKSLDNVPDRRRRPRYRDTYARDRCRQYGGHRSAGWLRSGWSPTAIRVFRSRLPHTRCSSRATSGIWKRIGCRRTTLHRSGSDCGPMRCKAAVALTGWSHRETKRSPVLGPGFEPRAAGERKTLRAVLRGAAYQLKRGPTNHSLSPSRFIFRSALRPQFWLSLAWAPRRP